MVDIRDELEEIDHVDESNFELWKVLAEECNGSEGFVSRDITTGCEDNVWICALVVACPVPDSNTFCAVLYCFIDVEELEMILLVCNDNIDVVGAAKTVICHREEAVSIRRKIYTDDFGTLVGNYIEETGILMCETVMILSPNCCCEKDIEGSDLDTPFDLETFFNPFAMLVYHGIDNVDEWFVAVKKTMTA